MAAHNAELHHVAPRCLLTLYGAVNGHDDAEGSPGYRQEALLEFERWRIPVSISREDLEALVEASTVVLNREKHRLIHQADFARWGRRGGRETLRRYGTDWFTALALKRWGRIAVEDLDAMRALR